MKQFVKNNLKVFVTLIISGIVFTGIGVYAASQYFAKDITFTPTNENFKKENGELVNNVEDALNELYIMKSSDTNCIKSEYVKPSNSSVNISLDFEPKFIFISFFNYFRSAQQYFIFDKNESINYAILKGSKSYTDGSLIIENNNIKYEFDKSGDNYKNSSTYSYIACK